MSTDDISQIIDRLARMEEKQDKQAEQIADIRVSLAEKAGQDTGRSTTKGDFVAKVAAYGGLLSGVGAVVVLLAGKS